MQRVTALKSLLLFPMFLASAALSGCGMESATPSDVSGDEQALVVPNGAHKQVTELEISEVVDPLGTETAGAKPASRAIRSAKAYEAAFGHAAPAEIDFAAGDIVLFYTPGVKPTGGYAASFVSVVQVGQIILATTLLASPGDNCFVTQALTKPSAVVVVHPVGRVAHVRFQHTNTTSDCDPPAPTCDDVTCEDGQHCELQEIVCITTPCNPIPTCVDHTTGPFCGGIAGIECPGSGVCTDAPGDGCSPENGGADCGGVCACLALGLCIDGLIWDESPDVCGCVENPCNLVDCLPDLVCEVQNGEPVCVPTVNPCAFTLCPINTSCEVENGEAVCTPIGGGETCGDVTCAEGQVCCNPSCGICTPPDGACIQLFCE